MSTNRELGWRQLAEKGQEVIIAGQVNDVIIAIVTKNDNETRTPVNIIGDSIISSIGPEAAGPNEMVFNLKIEPNQVKITENTVQIKVEYLDKAPATIITLPMVWPTVSYISPAEVKIGQRLIKIHGEFLKCCSVELLSTNGERIIRQKNFNDRIEVEVEAKKAGTCLFRLDYGKLKHQPINLKKTAVEMAVTFTAEKNQRSKCPYWPFLLGMILSILLLSILFLN